MKFSLFDLMHWPHPEPCGGEKQIDVYEHHLDEWVLAERLGFDAVWLSEHHFSDYNLMPSPNLMVAALAGRTQRIRVGVMINAVPFHDPLRLAEECAMLDVLSRGRLNCGFGRSADFQEYQRLNMPMEEARPRFQEGLEVIRRAWTEQHFDFEGQFYSYRDVTIRPRPLQTPHPPIFSGVRSPETHVWAAEQAIPIASIFLPVEQTRDSFELYRTESEKRGRRVGGEDFLVTRHVFVADTQKEALAAVQEPMFHFYRLFRDVAAPPNEEELQRYPQNFAAYKRFFRLFFEEEPTVEQLIAGGQLICGDPDTVAAEIRRQRDIIGTEHLMCLMNFGTLTHQQVTRSMELFGHEVLPRFA